MAAPNSNLAKCFAAGAVRPKKPNREPRVYPAWMDAPYAIVADKMLYADVTVPAAQVVIVAPGDPKRWRIGFILLSGAQTGLSIAPWPDPQQYPLRTLALVTVQEFTLHDNGVAVAYQWYAHCSSQTTVRVWWDAIQ